MPFDPQLLKRLRIAKGWTQSDLAKASGLKQPQVSECESGAVAPPVDVIEKLAQGLDCTPDFLLGWVRVTVADDDDLKSLASQMAYEAFARRLTTTHDQKARCSKVVGHRAAPLTADLWAILAEQLDLAFGPPNGGKKLHAINGGKVG